jgi:ABC-type uncharacterized transport system ATPase subunit
MRILEYRKNIYVMITKIQVDGFKSLNDFKLKIKPGLNFFIGPNGSGKTTMTTVNN